MSQYPQLRGKFIPVAYCDNNLLQVVAGGLACRDMTGLSAVGRGAKEETPTVNVKGSAVTDITAVTNIKESLCDTTMATPHS